MLNSLTLFKRYALIILLTWLLSPSPAFAIINETAIANFTPWSGYWWPLNVGGLGNGADYAGHPAPLEKYDTLAAGRRNGSASDWYLTKEYDPTVPNWYGFCGAWASAAVTEDINFQPGILDKVLFNVGDKKGLLTACHETDVSILGNATDPTLFHAWLLRYLKGTGAAFFADLDASEEIWNYPIYRYQMTSSKAGNTESVTCQIWYADDAVLPDFQGTMTLTKTYTYDLYTNSNGEITSGAWTGNSATDHPQVMYLPVTQHSPNPYLDCELVRNLARTNDDDLESDQPVAISPGDYMLLLLNQDDYIIDSDLGDTIILTVAKDSVATSKLTLQIHDGAGQLVNQTILSDAAQKLTIPSTSPPYRLAFTANSYVADNLYSLNFDLKKSFEFANTKLQKSFWNGFAITNAQEQTSTKITVVGYNQNGLPLATYLGPFNLNPGQKQTIQLSEFDVLPVDRVKLNGVKVIASTPLSVLNLFGYFGRSMSTYGSSPSRSRLVIPDITRKQDYSSSIMWGLYNPGLTDINADLALYTPQGVKLDSTVQAVPANRAVEYSPSQSPFRYEADHGWVLVNSQNNGLLQAYSEWLEVGYTKAEALGPLGINRSFFVPHVLAKGEWNESVTLINVSDTINTVTLTLLDQEGLASTVVTLSPFAKITSELSALFPGVADATLNRAALEIEAGNDLSGFVTYAKSGDDLHIPLLSQEDVLQKLTLPHVAAHDWWTGFALYNPSQSETVSVLATPYGSAGNRKSELAVPLIIAPHSKKVLMVGDLFGKDQDISFVTFACTSGPGLAGFYAIGNLANPMLSGTVMH